MFYVISGGFEIFINDQRSSAGPGSWVTLANGSLHHFKKIGATPGKLLNFAAPAGLDQFILEAGRAATDTSPASGAVTPQDIESLLAIAPNYGIEIRLPS